MLPSQGRDHTAQSNLSGVQNMPLQRGWQLGSSLAWEVSRQVVFPITSLSSYSLMFSQQFSFSFPF